MHVRRGRNGHPSPQSPVSQIKMILHTETGFRCVANARCGDGRSVIIDTRNEAGSLLDMRFGDVNWATPWQMRVDGPMCGHIDAQRPRYAIHPHFAQKLQKSILCSKPISSIQGILKIVFENAQFARTSKTPDFTVSSCTNLLHLERTRNPTCGAEPLQRERIYSIHRIFRLE